jgi:hypothetical protein
VGVDVGEAVGAGVGVVVVGAVGAAAPLACHAADETRTPVTESAMSCALIFAPKSIWQMLGFVDPSGVAKESRISSSFSSCPTFTTNFPGISVDVCVPITKNSVPAEKLDGVKG